MHPGVVVAAQPPRVHHPVDGAAAAKHTSGRPQRPAVLRRRIGFGFIGPVSAWSAHQEEGPRRHGGQKPIAAAARLKQQHPNLGVFAQAIGENTAGAAGADNDVVECIHLRVQFGASAR